MGKKRIALMPSTSLKLHTEKKKEIRKKLEASKTKASKAKELRASAEAIIVQQKTLIETLIVSKTVGWELKVKAAEQMITVKQTIITQQIEIISVTYTEIKEYHFEIIQEEEFIDYSYSVISKGKKSTKASKMINHARKHIKHYRSKARFTSGQLKVQNKELAEKQKLLATVTTVTQRIRIQIIITRITKQITFYKKTIYQCDFHLTNWKEKYHMAKHPDLFIKSKNKVIIALQKHLRMLVEQKKKIFAENEHLTIVIKSNIQILKTGVITRMTSTQTSTMMTTTKTTTTTRTTRPAARRAADSPVIVNAKKALAESKSKLDANNAKLSALQKSINESNSKLEAANKALNQAKSTRMEKSLTDKQKVEKAEHDHKAKLKLLEKKLKKTKSEPQAETLKSNSDQKKITQYNKDKASYEKQIALIKKSLTALAQRKIEFIRVYNEPFAFEDETIRILVTIYKQIDIWEVMIKNYSFSISSITVYIEQAQSSLDELKKSNDKQEYDTMVQKIKIETAKKMNLS